MREVKAFITLRSGKEVDHPRSKLKHDEESVAEKEKGNLQRKMTMIKQVSTYEKFLKDLCTVKRRFNVNKKVFLTEQVSVII